MSDGAPHRTDGGITPKPFVGLHMRCCNVYVRAYPNASGEAFVARCPRCGAPIRLDVDNQSGNSGQFFTAS